MYAAVKGMYKNGVLTLLEPAPDTVQSEVLVTFLIEPKSAPQKRVPGRLKRLGEIEGKVYSIPDNFNDPLDDLKDYM